MYHLTDPDQVVEHQSAILRLPGEIAIGQNSDHREMARFASLHDRNFRPVVSRLEKFYRDIVNRNVPNALGELSTAALDRSVSNASAFYEIPYPPCTTFRGREALLKNMEDFFSGRSGKEDGRLSFALCGLGGSGKTQTALHYAVRNRSRYASGIAILNATSEETIIADYCRISEWLSLGSVSDKVTATKEWLSREENSSWLLIFDNADNLESVSLSKYFPASFSGHIIITSRNGAAIGSLGQEGSVMDRLTTEDAVEVLLEKAGLRNVSEADMQMARVIVVELLGCLPLAVDQGGAFIRERRKSLADYYRLFQMHQNQVLSYRPRLAEYDKTVLTAWEMNFCQVERASPRASDLLQLFCSLDASDISELLLARGSSPQNRWGQDGEISKLDAKAAGLDHDLVDLIVDEEIFDAAIDQLQSFSLIQVRIDDRGSRSFSVHPLVQHCAVQRMSPDVCSKWRLQAILLVCQAFPHDQHLESL